MTKDEYMKFHEQCCQDMIAVTKVKNSDYSGTDPSPFANFLKVQAFGICSVEQGFLTRMTDKFSRITSFVQKGFLLVKDESVHDTLIDLANYCILMAGYLKEQREMAEQKKNALTNTIGSNDLGKNA